MIRMMVRTFLFLISSLALVCCCSFCSLSSSLLVACCLLFLGPVTVYLATIMVGRSLSLSLSLLLALLLLNYTQFTYVNMNRLPGGAVSHSPLVWLGSARLTPLEADEECHLDVWWCRFNHNHRHPTASSNDQIERSSRTRVRTQSGNTMYAQTYRKNQIKSSQQATSMRN